MKKITFVIALLLLIVLTANAQQQWALAVIKNGDDNPTIVEYHSIPEKGNDGTEYLRIYDDGFRFRGESYNPVRLQYGYRLSDKQIYIYDFDSQKETLAFDFNLSIGDQFTTFNGIEWVVDEVKDTLVNISFCGKGECVLKRLLAVRTLDGTMSDQWLEGFGSFYNHFMIKSLDGIKYSQTLWMEYEMGEYLAREINADPLFCHDSGWMDGTDDGDISDVPDTRCTYENGLLKFENVQWWWDHRDYTCFYRKGDDIYKLYSWEFEPHVESGASSLQKDVIIFENLPTPSSCQYTLHIDNDEYPTSIRNVTMHPVTSKGIYDMQGRQQTKHPVQGVYVEEGKKKFATK